MKDPEFKTIRRAVEKNCGGFDTASDAHIRSKWASLDDETRAAYLASVSAKREKPTDGDGATAPGGDAVNGLHKGSTFTIRADWIDEIDQGDRPAFRMLVPRYATKLRIGELLERASAHEAPSLPSDDDADSIATYRRDLSIAETVADELFGEYVTILDEHLVAWENVADVSGNPIAREGHGVADALDEIGVVALLMLFRGGSMLSNHEKKTSASPSPSPTAGRAEDAKKGCAAKRPGYIAPDIECASCAGTGGVCRVCYGRDEQCDECGGVARECRGCGGEGRYTLSGCLLEQVDEMAFDAIELSEMMALGTLSEAGGVLDQSAKAIAAHRMIRGDIASIEREELEKARGRS